MGQPKGPKQDEDYNVLKRRIEHAWQFSDSLEAADKRVVLEVIELLDTGKLRSASFDPDFMGNDPCKSWVVHDWVKQAILLYFKIAVMKEGNWGDYHWHDKIPLKTRLKEQNIRVVPPGTVRYGCFLEPGCVVMPGYVNIGAFVGAGTMVDTWATVGTCAQIGKGVHLSGGVGIGGVLEPPSARPVTVEDHVFIGSRAQVVEGVVVGSRAVLAMGVSFGASSHVIDMSGSETHDLGKCGFIPPDSVVIMGMREMKTPAGSLQVLTPCIIGKRKPSTEEKVSLNAALREFALPV